MRNYDFYIQEKQKLENQNKVLFILSWIFYKSFESDSRFLSNKFWFKIKKEWWYESVWFPKHVLEKYIKNLENYNYWYIIFDKIDWKFIKNKIFQWNKNLDYLENKLNYIETKKEEKIDFKSFLKDLSKLIEKYI